jgi:hypothetical protein
MCTRSCNTVATLSVKQVLSVCTHVAVPLDQQVFKLCLYYRDLVSRQPHLGVHERLLRS